MAITVRPLEYWLATAKERGAEATDRLIASHQTNGFAFDPHKIDMTGNGINQPNCEITYGDTSITIDWIEKNLCDWRVASTEHDQCDPYQVYVFLVPV